MCSITHYVTFWRTVTSVDTPWAFILLLLKALTSFPLFKALKALKEPLPYFFIAGKAEPDYFFFKDYKDCNNWEEMK
jgi:hypothetical protein